MDFFSNYPNYEVLLALIYETLTGYASEEEYLFLLGSCPLEIPEA